MSQKDEERERIAGDIKKYLARGGTIKTYSQGDTGVSSKLDWPKTLRHDPKRKGK